jgi:predicted transport protein
MKGTSLTLTGYNSELSDRPFLEKRNMPGGFADSPIRLNRSLAALEHWNEDEIRILSGQVIKVWAYPQVSVDVLMRYKEEDKTGGKEYTLANHPHLTGPMLELFNQFRKRVLNLDSSVTEEILKLYIAYKAATNFVDVVPQKSRLRLYINMRFSEIDDPKGLCKDVTNLGRWGNGDVEVGLSSAGQLEDVMYLVAQSFEKNMDNGSQ